MHGHMIDAAFPVHTSSNQLGASLGSTRRGDAYDAKDGVFVGVDADGVRGSSEC